MAAGEAENPRLVMPKAYNAVFYRLTAFFVLGSLCVGINVPFDSPMLIAAFEASYLESSFPETIDLRTHAFRGIG